jgi:Na+/H+ antiporter NhaC
MKSIAGFISRTEVIVVLWVLLFALTIFASGLHLRSLVAAFLAWVGGIVTAKLQYRVEMARELRKLVPLMEVSHDKSRT